jgi:hypothetical protein
MSDVSKRYARIPAPIDTGKTCDTTLSHIVHNYIQYKDWLRSGSKDEPLYDYVHRTVCGFPLPSFQRHLCWTEKQSIAFIESAWLGLSIGSYVVHQADWENPTAMPLKFSGWIIDGQQRLNAIEAYLNSKFPVFGLLYKDLTVIEARRFSSIKFTYREVAVWDEGKIRELYNRMNFGGVAHSEHERA